MILGLGVRQGAGKRESGVNRENGGARRPHTFPKKWFFSSLPPKRRGRSICGLSMCPWTSLAERSPPRSPVTIWASSHAPYFSDGNTGVSHLQRKSRVLSVPHQPGKFPLLFVGYLGPGMTVVAHFWDGLGPVRVDSVQVWAFRDVNQQVFPLQRTCRLCSPEMLKYEGGLHPRLVSSCFWKISASFSSSSTLPSSAEICLFSSFHRSTYFSPIYPVCSKHHESKSSLYPHTSHNFWHKGDSPKIFEGEGRNGRTMLPHWSICRAWDLNLILVLIFLTASLLSSSTPPSLLSPCWRK